MPLPDLAKLHRRERIDRLEGDELAPQPLQVAQGVGLFGLGAFVVDLDGLGVRQRLVLRKPKLRADLLLKELQRPGRTLFLDAFRTWRSP